MIDRQRFYRTARTELFAGRITTEQVHGCEAILNEWERAAFSDLRWLAYMFGTVYWECDKRMVPIEEYGRGKGRKYGVPAGPWGHIYYGRGLVQLTWHENYVRMGDILGLPLARQPDLALIPEIAVRIMFEGMTTSLSARGDFTGHSLEMYFDDETEDWIGARRIINRLDRAGHIAGISKKFYKALTA
ncbi:MAG: hypothetical protein ACREJC_11460 [Tepidisphaeraceae bacterium]